MSEESDAAIRAEIEEALRNTPVNPADVNPLPRYPQATPQVPYYPVVDSVESSHEKPMEVTCHVEEAFEEPGPEHRGAFVDLPGPEQVNHPKHYLNRAASIILAEHADQMFEVDGIVYRPVECIELMRRIKDPRLAHAFTYIWRIAFGGKANDSQDTEKARWFLNDFFEHPPVDL